MLSSVRTRRLVGRERELVVLERLLVSAREGHGAVLVVYGDPGVGKTALLESAADEAGDFRVLRAVGVEGEEELDYAALQQLCTPILELGGRLPDPQRAALDVTFGRSTGPAPSPFLVGLAILSLLSEAAEQQQVLCVVDDAQWLDAASARALAFAARRLLAERIVLTFATRDSEAGFGRLPQLRVEPLGRRDARDLLESVLVARLDEAVLERVVAETGGNPLAILELPRGLTPAQLAGGFGLPAAVPLSAGIEARFRQRLARLPVDTRRFLLLAAAETLGDLAVLGRAAQVLQVPPEATGAAESDGFVTLAGAVTFRHPLVRSAIYGSAEPYERRDAHRALAAATDPTLDPDRRAWHLSLAAPVPDEGVAAELERSAGRAEGRGGLAAVAAFLERAATLTPDPRRRARRLLAAAGAQRNAGDLEAALGLLARIEDGALDDLGRARSDLLRAQVAVEQQRGDDAGRLFLAAANRFEPLAPELARETYLEVLGGAMANDVEVAGGARVVAAAARAAPAGQQAPRTLDVVLDAFTTRLLDGYTAAASVFAEALELLLATDIPRGDVGRWLSLSRGRDGNVVALETWDDHAFRVLAVRQVDAARDTGALVHLQFALSFLVRSHILAGDLSAAAAVLDEADLVAEATGNPPLVNAPMILSAWRGDEAAASTLIEASAQEAAARRWISNGYARAVLCNGLGHYEEARDAARDAFRSDPIGYGTLLLPELAEAAARTGDRGLLEHAAEWIAQRARALSSGWAGGIDARVRALLADSSEAERLYRESIDHLSATSLRLELARSRLLYGEWLRRQRRRVDAREQLRIAQDAFGDMGAEAFARRAERELLATGGRARKRIVQQRDDLTPQETEVARLAAAGQTNREIAPQLFISPSTVEYHLRKVFRKLDVKTRTQLANRLRG
jgi:DNA-binding CsgD family transcriptional regulator